METTNGVGPKVTEAEAEQSQAERDFATFVKKYPSYPAQPAPTEADQAGVAFAEFKRKHPDFDYRARAPFALPSECELAYREYQRKNPIFGNLHREPFFAGYAVRDQGSYKDELAELARVTEEYPDTPLVEREQIARERIAAAKVVPAASVSPLPASSRAADAFAGPHESEAPVTL